MIASPKEPWIASEAFWWEVKGRALYSVWLVMKLIHGSLHRVIELLPLNRKLNSCAYSFDSCFAARNCYLQSPHHEGSLLSYFPGSHGAKVSHLESEFCWKCLCRSLTNLRVGWGPWAPRLGDQLLTVGSGAAGSACMAPPPSGSTPCPARCFSGEQLCSFRQHDREPLQGVPRALPISEMPFISH